MKPRSGRGSPAAVRRGEDLAGLLRCSREEVGVGGREAITRRETRRESDAIGHGKGPTFSMVVPGMEPAGYQADPLVDRNDVQATQSEPEEAFLHRIDRPASVTDEHVENLGEVEGTDEPRLTLIAKDRFDRFGGWLADQRRDDGLRIEDRQRRALRRSSFEASSSRRIERSSSVVGP